MALRIVASTVVLPTLVVPCDSLDVETRWVPEPSSAIAAAGTTNEPALACAWQCTKGPTFEPLVPFLLRWSSTSPLAGPFTVHPNVRSDEAEALVGSATATFEGVGTTTVKGGRSLVAFEVMRMLSLPVDHHGVLLPKVAAAPLG